MREKKKGMKHQIQIQIQVQIRVQIHPERKVKPGFYNVVMKSHLARKLIAARLSRLSRD
jgi:hypothetical protein